MKVLIQLKGHACKTTYLFIYVNLPSSKLQLITLLMVILINDN